MPELPEVETVRAGLDLLLPKKVVSKVTHDWPKSFPNDLNEVDSFLVGASILYVRRRAKVLIIDLSSNYSLVVHLKMTGQMIFRSEDLRFGAGHPNDSLIAELPDKTTRVILEFDDGSRLFFNDQRKFGWMRLLPTKEVFDIDFFRKVGPEPLVEDFSPKDFISRMRARNRSGIKAVLLDQSVIAGVGNIYADESLFAAKIHPMNRVELVSDDSLIDLYTELRRILNLSISLGGSTDRNYVDAEGKKGSYLEFAKVFRKENQACLDCGEKIKKIRVAGRGTHICPTCQPMREEDK